VGLVRLACTQGGIPQGRLRAVLAGSGWDARGCSFSCHASFALGHALCARAGPGRGNAIDKRGAIAMAGRHPLAQPRLTASSQLRSELTRWLRQTHTPRVHRSSRLTWIRHHSHTTPCPHLRPLLSPSAIPPQCQLHRSHRRHVPRFRLVGHDRSSYHRPPVHVDS
jgi:hypothetical protein